MGADVIFYRGPRPRWTGVAPANENLDRSPIQLPTKADQQPSHDLFFLSDVVDFMVGEIRLLCAAVFGFREWEGKDRWASSALR